jgi:hypothetical protein
LHQVCFFCFVILRFACVCARPRPRPRPRLCPCVQDLNPRTLLAGTLNGCTSQCAQEGTVSALHELVIGACTLTLLIRLYQCAVCVDVLWALSDSENGWFSNGYCPRVSDISVACTLLRSAIVCRVCSLSLRLPFHLVVDLVFSQPSAESALRFLCLQQDVARLEASSALGAAWRGRWLCVAM